MDLERHGGVFLADPDAAMASRAVDEFVDTVYLARRIGGVGRKHVVRDNRLPLHARQSRARVGETPRCPGVVRAGDETAKPEYPEQVGQGRTRPPSPDGSEQRTDDADRPVTGRGDSTPPASGEAEGLSRSELKRRAGAGVFVVGSWGLIRLAVQFGGNLALARLLTPRDFGIVAIGLTVLLIGRSISDGGMASALIRASEEPTREQLATLTGIQLLLTTAIAAVGIPVALQFGLAGQVTALMLLTLPLSALRSAPSVRLTRQLRFRELSAADGISLVAQYGVSLLLVAFGFGVWALAFGGVASTAGLVAGLAIIAPQAFVRPSLSRAGSSDRSSASVSASRRVGSSASCVSRE